jgi:hypothetical protein
LFERLISKTAAKMSRRGFAAGNNVFGLQRFGVIGHFCLLNPWFTVLQVLDESPKMSGILPLFTRIVLQQIRRRNDKILLVVSDERVSRR